MCLGAPGKILSIEGSEAVVDFFGVTRSVGLDLIDEPVVVGEHVLVHAGFAIHRIADEDVAETRALFTALTAGPAPEAEG